MRTLLKTPRIKTVLWITLAGLLLTACGSNDKVELQREVGRTTVVGMTADAVQLSAFENIFANSLRTEGDVVCLVATGLPELSEGINLRSLRSAANAANANSVIINRMILAADRNQSAGNLDAYLQSITPIPRVPGNSGLIESRVFDIESGELLWSGWSGEVNPRGRLQDLAERAQDLADDLAGDDVIKPVVVESLDNQQ